MNISEIPTLTLQQKKQFWKLGQDLWHITSLEVYENIARNVAVVLRKQSSHLIRGKTIVLQWTAEYPFRLLMAVLRHLTLLDVPLWVDWQGTPPALWKSIAQLLHSRMSGKTVPDSEKFLLLFVDEQAFLHKITQSSQRIQLGLIAVVPHLPVKGLVPGTAICPCSTTLIFDFPTIEFLQFKSNQPALRAFLGNTGIPVQLVHQLGVETKSIYASDSVIDLNYPNSDWHGSHCAGIYLG